MSNDKLDRLMEAHHAFCAAAGLPETTRPFLVHSRLEEVQSLIMEEIKGQSAPKTNIDDIPY